MICRYPSNKVHEKICIGLHCVESHIHFCKDSSIQDHIRSQHKHCSVDFRESAIA